MTDDTQHEAAIERIKAVLLSSIEPNDEAAAINASAMLDELAGAAYDAARSSRGIDAEIAGLLDRLEDFFLEHHDESAEKLHFYHEIRGIRAARSGEAEGLSEHPWRALDRIRAWSHWHKEEARSQLRGTMKQIHEEALAALAEHPEPRQDQPVELRPLESWASDE